MDLSVVVETEELRVSPDVVAALAFHGQGLSAEDWSPPDEPSQGFLGGEGTSSQGFVVRAHEPRAPRSGGVLCHVVSCRLRDFVGGVPNSASRPLVWPVLRSPCAWPEPWTLGQANP